MESIGCAAQFSSIKTTSLAARCRNATSTLANFDAVDGYHRDTLNHTECLVNPYADTWLRYSVLQQMKDALQEVSNTGFGITAIRCSSQRALTLHLRSSGRFFCPRELLERRLQRFFVGSDYKCHVQTMLQKRLEFRKRFKPCLQVCHLQLVLNQWCTTRRFGQGAKACPFDCGHETDELEHCAVCPAFQVLFHSYLRNPVELLTLENLTLLHYNDGSACPDMDHYIMIYIHTAFGCFNACRHGAKLSKRLIVNHLKTLITHCPRSGFLVRRLQRSPMQFLTDIRH